MERVRAAHLRDPAVDPVPGVVPLSSVTGRPARISGVVTRLVFEPDGGEGRLLATIDDGTGMLVAGLPRAHARDWAPGAGIAAEGAVVDGTFVVRAYLPVSDDGPASSWVEVVPLSVR